MTEPFISVVIPAYNAENFILKTLDSVLSQTYTNYELIVVDDGSIDNTSMIVENYLNKHNLRWKCIRQHNKKIAGARNTGIQAASGEFIALLDHDDIWYPNKLKLVSEVFQSRPELALVGHHMNVTKDGRFLYMARKGPSVKFMYEYLLFNGNAITPSGAVVRRNIALSIGGFREDPELNTVEDYDFWLRLSQVGQFYFIEQALAEYALIENSASSRVDYHYGNLEFLLRDHFKSYYRNSLSLMSRLLIRRRMAIVYRSAANALNSSGGSHEHQMNYLIRMFRTYPLSILNLYVALRCLIRTSLRSVKM
jgi:teichuronic acid biosynthesis glycosyltransferase TuaG